MVQKIPAWILRSRAIRATAKFLVLSCIFSSFAGFEAKAYELAGKQSLDLVLNTPEPAPESGPESGKILHPDEAAKQVKVKDVTLNGLRDGCLTLHQLKQETIHLYLEATRVPMDTSSKSEVAFPMRISDKNLLDNSQYLPPRTEWLVYYIGTIEPIIQLFGQNLQAVHDGVVKRMVPKETRETLKPLSESWRADIASLNEHLDKLNALMLASTTDNNAVAREAVAMFNTTENMDKIRRQFFEVIRSADERGSSEKVEL
jgi:hypothetical protein